MENPDSESAVVDGTLARLMCWLTNSEKDSQPDGRLPFSRSTMISGTKRVKLRATILAFFARTSPRHRSATIAWTQRWGMLHSNWSSFGEILTRPISFPDSARCKPGRDFDWHNIRHPRVSPYLGDRFPGGRSAVRSTMPSLTALELSFPTQLSCLLTGTFRT